MASRRTQVTAAVAVLTVSLVFFSYLVLERSYKNSSVTPAANTAAVYESGQTRSGLPVRLRIPKINVDAVVESVGLTAQEAMDVPAGPVDTAWFNLGPRPGETGSAVIAGHYGWKDGTPAVFDDLSALQAGDTVYVDGGDGVTTAFVVREVRTYGKDENDADIFGSSDGKSHLNLITCEGDWNKAQQSYSDRLVVFADQETEQQPIMRGTVDVPITPNY